jgi:hypothetical protein
VRWLLFGAGGLACAVALVGVWGTLLPQGHVAARRAHYQHSAESLFAILTDFASAPFWRRSVKSVVLLPAREGKASFREIGSNGALTFVVDEQTAPTKLVTRIVDNAALGGSWTFELLPDASAPGCQLTITERGEVYNPFFRFIGHFLLSQTATVDSTLIALGHRVGEVTAPESLTPP